MEVSAVAGSKDTGERPAPRESCRRPQSRAPKGRFFPKNGYFEHFYLWEIKVKMWKIPQFFLAKSAPAARHFPLFLPWRACGAPFHAIFPLERACGVPLITRYLAAAHGKLLVDIPTGRKCQAQDVQQLQTVLNSAVGALLAFSDGKQSAGQTLDEVRAGIETLAWHHGNIQQHDHPQLELGDPDDE